MLTVHIVVLTELAQYATYSHAIKVTVDGPREPRSKQMKLFIAELPLAHKDNHRSWVFDIHVQLVSEFYFNRDSWYGIRTLSLFFIAWRSEPFALI